MNYVVVDLEMNKVAKEFSIQRKSNVNEVIEIGAVVLDDSYNEISSFKTYVKPRFNSIVEKKIEKLTGITFSMLEDAPYFEEAFKMFVDFCENLNGEYVILQWSESDQKQIEKEIVQKHYEMNEKEKKLMENWHDFQHEFTDILGLEKRISLENALMYAGEDFVGNQHDALYDARNTAELFAITRVEEKKKKALDKVIKILHHEEQKVTLGDMFDFSSILAAISENEEENKS